MITDPSRVFYTSKTYVLSKTNGKRRIRIFFHVSRTSVMRKEKKGKLLQWKKIPSYEHMKRVESLRSSFLY